MCVCMWCVCVCFVKNNRLTVCVQVVKSNGGKDTVTEYFSVLVSLCNPLCTTPHPHHGILGDQVMCILTYR